MVPDTPIWEWKFFDVSILVSALFFAAARPLWFVGKFLIYAAFSRALSWQWVIRLCARLWMITNWDIGAAIFGMFENRWIVRSASEPKERRVQIEIENQEETDPKAATGTFVIGYPQNTRDSEREHIGNYNMSVVNMLRVDKRKQYHYSFRAALRDLLEKQNARRLEKWKRKK